MRGGAGAAGKWGLELGDEPAGVLGGDGAEEDLDDGPPGGGVHGGELVHLPDAFELADGEAVDGNEIAWPAGPVAVVGATGSITGPTLRVDLQPQPPDRKYQCVVLDGLVTPGGGLVPGSTLRRRHGQLRAEDGHRGDWIQVFYHRRRRHSGLEMLAPVAYEKLHADNTSAA